MAGDGGVGSGGQALAAFGATLGQHAATADCGHAGAKAVTPGANDLTWLKGALHGTNSEGLAKTNHAV